jgi:hypothetical protein
MLSKLLKRIQLNSQTVATCLCLTNEIQHKKGQMFQSHQLRGLPQIPQPRLS